MKCKKCKSKMEYREFLAEMDSENLKRLDYYYCGGCGIIYNTLGDTVMEPSRKWTTSKDKNTTLK